MTDAWFQELFNAPHEPGLCRALFQAESQIKKHIGDEKKDSFEIIHALRDDIRTCAHLAIESGRRHALSYLPKKDLEKLSGYFDWDIDHDISKIVQSIREAPSPGINQAVHEALAAGKHPQDVVRKLTKEYQVDRARDIARTVMLNVYAKGNLREMSRHGYDEAIRMEVHDKKVCATCKSLDGKVYKIARIIDLPNPLTNDTHARCRGTFIPVINPGLVRPDEPGTIQHTKSFEIPGGKKVVGVPQEFAMYLKRFLTKNNPPFDIVFDQTLKGVDSRLGEDTLRIHPRALVDQDPRELISEAWAKKLWPQYRSRFEDEYLLLTGMGPENPSKAVQTPEELWMSAFVDWKTNQLSQPFENVWFATTIRDSSKE